MASLVLLYWPAAQSAQDALFVDEPCPAGQNECGLQVVAPLLSLKVPSTQPQQRLQS